MKNIIIKSFLIIVLLGVGFISCNDLDLQPKGQFGDAEFFGNDAGVQYYFATLYGWLPIEDFLFMAGNDGNEGGYRKGDDHRDAWGTWEAQKRGLGCMAGELIGQWQRINNDGPNYWRYDRVREVNNFIEKFPEYQNDWTNPVRYNEILGEAHFLRAYFYEGMVRRYGGVPIIKNVQSPTDPYNKLAVPRNTEYDVYKFIYEDLQYAIDNMTSVPDKYRGTRWTALALMSRCMLYAATIAKYSEYVGYDGRAAYDQGFAGMKPPEGKTRAEIAEEFFKYSYDASKELIEEGPYSLYTKYGATAKNFHDMLLDPESTETIFTKNYVHHDQFDRLAFLIGHNWDACMSPMNAIFPEHSMGGFDAGAQSYPSLDMIRMYEGFPDLFNADKTVRRWDSPNDIALEEMEPRLRGSVYFNGDQLRGATFNTQRGIYRTFTWTKDDLIGLNPMTQAMDYKYYVGDNSDKPNFGSKGSEEGTGDWNRISTESYTEYWNPAQEKIVKWDPDNTPPVPAGSIRIIGYHGMQTPAGGGENNSLTGTFVRKYIDEEFGATDRTVVKEHASFQPWIEFRLGETYLNLAEAAYELGYKDEAGKAISEIRKRAGCKTYISDDLPTDPSAVCEWEYFQTTDVTQGNIPIDVELQFIRDERYREPWAENHRWWDQRRWRTARYVYENWIPRILSCYYVLDEDKYIYLDEKEERNRNWNADRQCYYQGIPDGEINKNPKLLPRNPWRGD